jgi:hypothetical protein
VRDGTIVLEVGPLTAENRVQYAEDEKDIGNVGGQSSHAPS